MKFKIISFVCLFLSLVLTQIPVFAQDDYDKTLNQAKSSYTNYSDCIRLYKLPEEKLFTLALSAISSHRYEILEMQSRNGYIIFQTCGKEFLASIMKRDKNYSYLKIAPADNNYYFSSEIPKKIFNYVDLNFNEELKELKF